MKHRRQHAPAAAMWFITALALSWGNAWPEERLPPIGGPGGGAFTTRCAPGEFLVGLDSRAGIYVDAVRPRCATVKSPNTAGSESVGGWAGGFGGGTTRIVCPDEQPLASGMFVETADQDENVVTNLLLYCGNTPDTRVSSYARPVEKGRVSGTQDDTQGCPRGQLVVGIHGRSGKYLDAIGLICDAPPTAQPSPVKSIGRVGTGTPPPVHPPGWTICDAARDARSRSSPATPNLETQCKALNLSPTTTAKSTGTTAASVSPSATTTPPPAPPQSDNGTGHPSKAETRDAMFRALAESIASMGDQPHSSAADDADGVPATMPGERVIGNRQDRYPVDSRPGRHQTTQASRGLTVQDLTQPENSIRIKVRYPTAYGYKEAIDGLDYDPNSCMAFHVSALPASSTRPLKLIRVDTLPHMRSSNGLYTCEYQMQDLPLDQPLLVRVMMSDQRAAGSEIWLGGSQPQPPSGQRRTILDGNRQVLLSADRPRAALDFEMAYSGGVQ